MKKGGGNSEHDGSRGRKNGGGQNFIQNKNKMKKNMQRLGGGKGGLSLESFANVGNRNDNYNPSLIKKQKEFYRNAKYVQKYKKLLKPQQQNTHLTAEKPVEGGLERKEDDNDVNSQNEKNKNGAIETKEDGHDVKSQNKKSKNCARSLKELYEKKREEEEKARREREAMIEAKKEKIRATEDRRKALKGKMYKKTRFGQPVMKYRIEHLLETIQGSSS